MKIGPDSLLYVLQWSGKGTVKRYKLDGTNLGDFTEAVNIAYINGKADLIDAAEHHFVEIIEKMRNDLP